MKPFLIQIELVNAIDSAFAKRRIIEPNAVRRTAIFARPKKESPMLVINEKTRDFLGLEPIGGKRISHLADGSRVELEVVGPVEVHFEGRLAMCNALVLPGDEEPLLGAIPMEELDVVVHPLRQTLVGAHPEGQVMALSGVS